MGNCQNDCGCGHEHHDHKKIYLTLVDNTEIACSVLSIFKADNKEYIAVLPEDSETPLIYRFVEKDGGPELSNIESDEEYEIASQAFLETVNHDEE
ncbi:Protein of unknown function [Anaerovirgula multivorans]|uniref:DUF1292 domain-containing protein n=1 Tax=Anaerovirgula multivorans TaxID=312168 RepID=A0A239L9D9_9FIRM|nr:DUF1292 domain-containing protein [Anaerovirgula multivorans]SNT27081.1 Protein of unknown function [Anaerovirgula multivorans]